MVDCNGLPLYSSDEPIAKLRRGGVFVLPPKPQATAVRVVQMWGNGMFGQSLREVLDLADKTFTEVAEYTGTQLPNYQWGIQAQPAKTYDPRIPESHRLVLEVEVIDEVQPLSPAERIQVDKGLLKHYYYGSSELVWRDAKSYQFAKGIGRIGNNESLFLLDLEPCADIRTPATFWIRLKEAGNTNIPDLADL